eukprot:2703422-Pyramimonas_sp.AAC.1
MPDPLVFRDSQGQDYPLITTSPALIKKLCQSQWQLQLYVKAGQKLGFDEPLDRSVMQHALQDSTAQARKRKTLHSYGCQ